LQVDHPMMVIDMDESKLRTIAQLQEFLAATPEVRFTGIAPDGAHDDGRYAHISRAQLKRLVARWHTNRLAAVPLTKRYCTPAAAFARKYTAADIELLVEMDQANEDACGAAIVHLFKRAWHQYRDPRYERLAQLSVSHLYNLRKSASYQARAPARAGDRGGGGVPEPTGATGPRPDRCHRLGTPRGGCQPVAARQVVGVLTGPT
jgi:hypothetical protein